MLPSFYNGITDFYNFSYLFYAEINRKILYYIKYIKIIK